jgi:hypothetical protein
VNGACGEEPRDAQRPAPPAGDCAAQGLTDCGGVCVSTASDVLHCGGCNQGCAVLEDCNDGICTAPPAALAPEQIEPEQIVTCADQGLTDCAGVCVDTTSDSGHCGGCGIGCGADPCVAGVCTPAQAPLDQQPLVEAPLVEEVIVEEPIVEEPIVEEPLVVDCAAQGLTDCGGFCVDTFSDAGNCGFCGNFCPDGATCFGGACA